MKAKKSHYRLPVVAALLLIMTNHQGSAIHLRSYEPDDTGDALLYSQATSDPDTDTTEKTEEEVKPEEQDLESLYNQVSSGKSIEEAKANVKNEKLEKKLEKAENESYETALVGSEGLSTGTTELTADQSSKEAFGDMDITQQSDALAQMVEENKGLLQEQHKVELKKEKANKVKAKKEKKMKEKEAKEEKLMKQADPELLNALSNDKFTEDMLEMLLKQGDKKTPKSFYD